MKILIAVDGSEHSLHAVDYFIKHLDDWRERPSVELITVHLPLPHLPNMHLVVSNKQVQAYYDEEGAASLATARERLQSAGVAFQSHVLVGQIAETIVRHAKQTSCDLVLIGTHGRGAAAGMVMGSIATAVVHRADAPVLLVK